MPKTKVGAKRMTIADMEREAVAREGAAAWHETEARHIRAAAAAWRAAIAKAEGR